MTVDLRPSPAIRSVVARPRRWPFRASDMIAFVAANLVLIVGMWIRHGGLDQLTDAAGILTAAGQLTALVGTYAALLQIVLMSRSPWLDQLFGMDRLAAWHRWLGFAVLWLLVGHTVFTTVGYALGTTGIIDEAWALLTTYPYVLMATVSLALMGLVAVTSIRYARRRLSYESWYFVHLYAYLAIALGFAHQLVVGTDFQSDPVARIYWIALYAAVIVAIVAFRVAQPIRLSLRHRFRVANVVREGPEAVSVYVTGRHLEELPIKAGQYLLWRFLAGDGWWRAHPFSISAAPNGRYLRLTIKDVGDYTSLLQRVQPGTAVFAEGPYGAFTDDRRTATRAVLIAGGIGITPLRALLEEMPAAPGALTLVYRASSWDDVLFRGELDALMQVRHAKVIYLIGRRGTREMPRDPLQPDILRSLIPDVVSADLFMCGPVGMQETIRRSLRTLGVPSSRIHGESFVY